MATSLTYKRIFGSYGSGDGEFSNPAACAVYNNELYVSDLANNRIQVVDLSGNYIRQWSVTSPTKIQIFNGHVLVLSVGVLYEYSTTGTLIASYLFQDSPLYTFCVTADYVVGIKYNGLVDVYGPLATFSTYSPISRSYPMGSCTVMDMCFYNGYFYISGGALGDEKIWVFDASTVSVVSTYTPTEGGPVTIDGIAVDATGIYVAPESVEVFVYDLSGNYQNLYAVGSGNPFGPYGMTLYNGELYIANSPYNNILVYEEPFSAPNLNALWFSTDF